ncbi:MAG TPA: hydrogenase expression/formation protein HypE [Anaerolineales bacterium]|nr:hydrogenase expression/formation protein HypE [Anaerolineales bacterium]
MKPEDVIIEGAVCPVPLPHRKRIVLGHGSGGKLSQDLITRLFLPPFANPVLNAGDDAGVVEFEAGIRLAISTDSHVVWPLFFPGGDIGRLAVCGTVNDVAMMGAVPLFLTAGFILEEGLDFEVLEQVVQSMQIAAAEAGVQLIAGDTKVVQRGKADSLYINTTGVGLISDGASIGGSRAQPGDKVFLSGPVGDHGIAVLSARGELGFEAMVQSDIAPLNHLVQAILRTAQEEGSLSDIHVLRDPTRGGVATTLNEIARQSNDAILIREDRLPVRPAVAAACELLGFDPLYIANEGKLIAIVAPEVAAPVLETMRRTKYGREAVEIGEVLASPAGRVLMRTTIGSTRIVDTLAGELLPRIC